MPTAAMIVIGNELLSGKFADENGTHVIRRLRALGCDLVRLVFIPDGLETIASEVRLCASLADHVITSGGVGPTHDDMTLAGVARAFDLPTVVQPELVALMARFGVPQTAATLRMATVPEGTELVMSAHNNYPALRCRNVWILPGIPRLFHAKFESIADRFAGPGLHTHRLYVNEYETVFAHQLDLVVPRFPTVEIGSYPRTGERHYRVMLTLESRDPDALAAAVAALAELLPLVTLPSR